MFVEKSIDDEAVSTDQYFNHLTEGFWRDTHTHSPCQPILIVLANQYS